MNLIRNTIVALIALLAPISIAQADCGIPSGSVRLLSDDFTALHTIASRTQECATETVHVSKNQTAEHKSIQVPALSAEPSTYTIALVPNNSLPPLLNDDLVRPLNDLVERYGQNLQESQLIRIDGKVMAVAFMVNTQHLWYRKDLLERAGIMSAPTTYEEVLAAARSLREKGIMEYPLALNLKPGWDLGTEFVNLYAGFGGELFKPGTAESSIEGSSGIKTLRMLKALSEFMSPDFATFNTNEVARLWAAGEVAIYNGWNSRTGAVIDPAGASTPEVIAHSIFTAAPTVQNGKTPASYLWWVGFVIAKHSSETDAEASFRAMMHAISPELLAEHSTEAVWLIEGYQPTPAAAGAFETVKAGAQPFPMLPYMGLLHSALSDNLIEFLQGKESAEQALTDVTRAYTTAASEGGFLK